MNQTNLKTFIPAVVFLLTLIFQAIHFNVDQATLTNVVGLAVNLAVAIWGIWKNHQTVIVPSPVQTVQEHPATISQP